MTEKKKHYLVFPVGYICQMTTKFSVSQITALLFGSYMQVIRLASSLIYISTDRRTEAKSEWFEMVGKYLAYG